MPITDADLHSPPRSIDLFRHSPIVIAREHTPDRTAPIRLSPDVFLELGKGAPVLVLQRPQQFVFPDVESKLARDDVFTKRVLDEAQSHLGYREGRGNRNMFSAHFGRGPEMWCADFVSYVFARAGWPIGQHGSASVAGLAEHFKANGEVFKKGEPAPGDVVFLNNLRRGRFNHVGIIERVANGKIYTIEGNVGGKHGGVARRVHTLGSNEIVGFGRAQL